MFWSGNYMHVKDLKSLLQEENVTLTQVLEASEILTECKANNTALVQYVTRPDILSELITMITEEPPKELDKQLQYRYANIACEVLTSNIATLKEKLSSEPALMSRLCDFVEQEPPLNPLLASFFSRMLEMLFAKSFKEDWCLYNIVCLRVLDVLQARDFLPALLRHMATSAAADALLLLLRLEDALHDTVTAWLERHNTMDQLLALACGDHQHHDVDARRRRAAADNAVRLLAELIEQPSPENCEQIRGSVLAGLRSAAVMESLLQRTFGGEEGPARVCALTNGGRILELLLTSANWPWQRAEVERAMGPHLPLLHRALLTPYAGGVGRHRVQLARLVTVLVSSKEPTVGTALVALGTVDALFDLSRSYPDNCFLRAAAVQAVNDAIDADWALYFNHLFHECDIATKILDTMEDEGNKNKLGHMWSLVHHFQCSQLPKAALDRYDASFSSTLEPILSRLETPLGGYHPSEKNFEEGAMGAMGVTTPLFDTEEVFEEILNKMLPLPTNLDVLGINEDGDKYVLCCDTNDDPDDGGHISPWVGDEAAEEAEDEGWARWSDVFPSADDDDRRTLAAIADDQQLQMEFTNNCRDAEFLLWDAPAARADDFTELGTDLLNVMSGMTIADIVNEHQVPTTNNTIPEQAEPSTQHNLWQPDDAQSHKSSPANDNIQKEHDNLQTEQHKPPAELIISQDEQTNKLLNELPQSEPARDNLESEHNNLPEDNVKCSTDSSQSSVNACAKADSSAGQSALMTETAQPGEQNGAEKQCDDIKCSLGGASLADDEQVTVQAQHNEDEAVAATLASECESPSDASER